MNSPLFPALVTFGPLLLLLVFGASGHTNSFRRAPNGISLPAIGLSLLFILAAVLLWFLLG